MATIQDLLSKVNKETKSATSESFFMYGTAMADSANGEVLVKLDDAIDETYIDPDEGITISLSEEDNTEDAIDEDYLADELALTDDPLDIDEDETEYYEPDGGMGDV